MRIKVSTKQRQFLQSTTRGTLYRGGIGSGKSRILCYKAILNSLIGRRELIVSFSYPMLRDVILHTLLESLPIFGLVEDKDYTVNKTEMIVTVHGTQILLRSGDAPNSIRGLNVHDFYIDEARNFQTDEIFLICLGRIRECADAKWYISSSPRGKDWVHTLSKTEGVSLIVQKTSENPFLPPSYIAELRARYTTQFAKQELDAEICELGAGVINPDWIKIVKSWPFNNPCRAWDLAVSTKSSADFTAGSLGTLDNSIFCLHNVIHKKLEYADTRKLIIETARIDGPETIIAIEQAGQQAGFISDLRSEPLLLPYAIKGIKPWTDKLNRALPWVTRAEAGKMYMVEGAWNEKVIDELRDFSADGTHTHDDIVDSISSLYNVLSKSVGISAGRVKF
jgi:predicted phage terminase large subunit-like protein